mmetsp:Transcript_1009/g.2223  ORF Transcript_1009/g.2223 Transcript_1009/m.2223 type:complete len:405 (-) Transcript_1009:32-1246(-)
MTHYLDETYSISESVHQNLSDAIRQGLSKNTSKGQKPSAASANKRKRTDASKEDFTIYSPDGDEQPNSLVSLTGDVVVEPTPGTRSVKIQSKSEFMTAVYVLERQGEVQSSSVGSYYYEVTLVTGGLAQIGWACLMDGSDGKHSGSASGFEPSNDLGDGVGDDASSFAVDGSRGLKFHGGEDWNFPIEWKAGDRLGCKLTTKNSDPKQAGSGSTSISFALNGKDLGVAFTDIASKPLVPAFSCNQDEILELHLTKEDCKYYPVDEHGLTAVKSPASSEPPWVKEQDSTKSDGNDHNDKVSTTFVSASNGKTTGSGMAPSPSKTAPVEPEKVKELILPEILNLDLFKSVQELEELGLDRLKSALLALKVKCGGTLHQRAERLFSLKGLNYKDFPKKVRAKGFVER